MEFTTEGTARLRPTEEQQACADAFRTRENLVISAGAGTGKALRDDQPVLTSEGWRPIGQIWVGDWVFDDGGLPCRVLGVYPQGVRPMYEVVTRSVRGRGGEVVVVADADHLWMTETTVSRQHRQADEGACFKVSTTAEIARTLTVWHSGRHRTNHYLPMAHPVQFPAVDLPLDPWLIGALVSDGSLTGVPRVTKNDIDFLAAVDRYLPVGLEMTMADWSGITWSLRSPQRQVVPGRRGCVSPLIDALRDLGLWQKRSWEKSLPDVVLRGSVDQRLSVLQGLLDGDGASGQHCVEWTTTSPVLAEQFEWLVHSLGGTCSTDSRYTYFTYNGEKKRGRRSYRVRPVLPEGMAYFRHHSAKVATSGAGRTKYHPRRQIVDVRPIAAASATCIEVDSSSHLYLTAGCIPTHNTSVLKMMAGSTARKGLYLAFNKALRSDQNVMTPTGWRPIGDLAVGDLVMGSDGRPRRVTKVHPQGVRPLYEVVFSDGTVVVADDGHLWTTQTVVYDAKRNQWRDRTTEQIARTVHQRHRVPHLSQPLCLPERDLPLDPYLLGALLGNGSYRHRSVQFVSHLQDATDFAAQIRRVLPARHSLNLLAAGPQTSGRLSQQYTITSDDRGPGRNAVLNGLRDLGLHGHAATTKYVPVQYLFASAAQRLALLQGLMDTDGCASGVRALFRTSSKQLAMDVVFLAQSLAGVADVGTTVFNEESYHDSYLVNVRIAVELCPFRLARKVQSWRPRARDCQTARKITAVRRVPPAEAVCISIDAADQLFVTEGCILTHNSVATEAKASFPSSIAPMTGHSLAYRWIVRQWGDALNERLRGNRVTPVEVARILGCAKTYLRFESGLVLAPHQIARLAMETVQRWCYSDETVIESWHVPSVPRIDSPTDRKALRLAVVPLARKAWEDLSRPDGVLRFSHDCYLKIFALTRPRLPYDYICLDESQDANGIIVGLLQHQDAQLAVVGDRSQAIYRWRNSIDSMEVFAAPHRLDLTMSWRFGHDIAEHANVWLELLQAELRLRGNPAVDSSLDELGTLARAVLCRSNAGVVQEVVDCHDAGRSVAIVGGGEAVVKFARAAEELKVRGRTSHPDLFPFENWAQVQDYVRDSFDGRELKVWVDLIDKYGTDQVVAIISRCVNYGLRGQEASRAQAGAQVVVSTAHAAKGLEFASVRIGTDFERSEPKENIETGLTPEPQIEELMLSYVAVTRAQNVLDVGGLSWVNKPEFIKLFREPIGAS